MRIAALRPVGVALVLALAIATSGDARAVKPDEVLTDPALEARARALSQEIRCLVCQNQSIDDSEADLARDLRLLVRERIKAGDSDSAVIAYLVARYGDYVLLKPPVKPATYPLWFGPILIAAFGGAGIAVYLRRRMLQPDEGRNELSTEERARLERIMSGSSPSDGASGPSGDASERPEIR